MPRWCPFADGETEAKRGYKKLTHIFAASKRLTGCLAFLSCRITSMVLRCDSTEAEKCNLCNHLAPAENEYYSKAPASYHSQYELSASHFSL